MESRRPVVVMYPKKDSRLSAIRPRTVSIRIHLREPSITSFASTVPERKQVRVRAGDKKELEDDVRRRRMSRRDGAYRASPKRSLRRSRRG
jgi:hypothetical protein